MERHRDIIYKVAMLFHHLPLMTNEDGIENFKKNFNLYGTVNKISLDQLSKCHKIDSFMTFHHIFVMFPSLQTSIT
jgi:hypothetical protein